MAALGAKLRTLEGGRVAFWCPGCSQAHQITVSRDAAPDGPCWGFDGNVKRPTFTPSILVACAARRMTDEEYSRAMQGEKIDLPQMRCHSYVTKGRILFLQDCTHALAGKTVDLPNWPLGGA
jgi:hypothetical protein